MGARFKLASTLAVIALVAGPVFAEKNKGGRNHGKMSWHCPPGLAKKNPPCVPPGQAKKQGWDHRHRVGDRLNLADYLLIQDPWRYGLNDRDGWNYYRDPYGIYRVDPTTLKILAVFELIEAFSN